MNVRVIYGPWESYHGGLRRRRHEFWLEGSKNMGRWTWQYAEHEVFPPRRRDVDVQLYMAALVMPCTLLMAVLTRGGVLTLTGIPVACLLALVIERLQRNG